MKAYFQNGILKLCISHHKNKLHLPHDCGSPTHTHTRTHARARALDSSKDASVS